MIDGYVDWPEMLGKLRKHYGSLEQMAKELGVNASTLRAIDRREVTNPRFNTGIRIFNLYLKIQPDKIDWALSQVEGVQ